MLNLYAATEHINYAKNVRLYIQMMINLKHDGDYGTWISLCLANQQTFGRSWTDLVIEYPMMRSAKSIGGLTKRNEMIQFVRYLWVSTLHSCGEVEQSMCKFIGTARLSSEQHIELGSSRCNRDFDDLKKVYSLFQMFETFNSKDERLRFLSSE